MLRRWHELNEEQQAIVETGLGRMSGAIRDGLLGEKQLFLNACDIAERFGEYDLIPTLVTIAEQPNSSRSPIAMKLIRRLVDSLTQMLHDPEPPAGGRDPEMIRKFVLESLERAVGRFRVHRQGMLIDSFVALAGSSSETLQSILSDPLHACYQSVIQTLAESNCPGVIHLLFEYLKQPNAPGAIHNVVSRRTDPAFVAALCSFVGSTSSKHVERNLARIKTYDWLAPLPTLCDRFTDAQLAAAARLIGKSGLKDRHLLDFLEQLLNSGKEAAKLAACECLASRVGDRADALALAALDDPLPSVQAAAARQLGNRPIHDRLTRLLALLESPHEVVQIAARESLREFTLESYMAEFDQMDDAVRRNRGALLRRVDGDLSQKLRDELAGPSVARRLRAIEMAEAIGVLPTIADALVECLGDEDHMVRASAADALQFCTGGRRPQCAHGCTVGQECRCTELRTQQP